MLVSHPIKKLSGCNKGQESWIARLRQLINHKTRILYMESTRQSRIARLIQKELSEIFRMQTAKIGNVIVSVSAVRVSPDLSIAHVYLSLFPSANAAQLLQNITRNAKTVRYDLAQRVRYQLRKTPELLFHLDDSLDYIEHIDQLLEDDRRKHPGSQREEDDETPAGE